MLVFSSAASSSSPRARCCVCSVVSSAASSWSQPSCLPPKHTLHVGPAEVLPPRCSRRGAPEPLQVQEGLVGQQPLVIPFLKVAQKYLDILMNYCTTHQKSGLT